MPILLLAGPAEASRGTGQDGLNRFIAARLVESADKGSAAELYAAGLREQPGNLLLAGKAYQQGVEAGDFNLALTAVRAIQRSSQQQPEMPILLAADAIASRNWSELAAASTELKSLGNFGFLEPLLNAWMAQATGKSAVRELKAADEDRVAQYYHQEQLVLHGLANGQERDVLPLLENIVEKNEARMAPIRILAARHFLAKKDTTQAAMLVAAERTGPESRLRMQIGTGNWRQNAQKVTAKVGAAFLLQRLATDLGMQRAYFPALVSALAASRIMPDSDYGQMVLAEALANLDSYGPAEEQLGKIDPLSVYALVSISREVAALAERGDYERAEKRLGQRIKQEPYRPELYLLLGQARQMKRDFSAAVEAFTQAINLAEMAELPEETQANYWLSLGSAQEQAGIWPGGLESLKMANQLQPDSPSILNYLGYAQLERRENTTEAIKAIERAFELRSSSPAITDSLGWAYFIAGDHEKAVQFLEKARAGEPQDPTINEHLGDAYWTVGRKFEARYAWRSAKLFADASDLQRLKDKIDLGLRPELVSP